MQLKAAIPVIIILTICGLAVLSTDTVDYDHAEADVEARLTKIIAIRENAVREAERSKSSYSDLNYAFLNYEPEAIALDKKALSASAIYIYQSAFINELKCTNPQHREVAFSMLESTFNPELAPYLARLLNDTSEVIQSSFSISPESRNHQQSQKLVCDYARNALEHQTLVTFNSETAFNSWWMKNGKNYRQKPWYWVARWYYGDPRTMHYSAGIPIDDEHIRDLSGLNPAVALRILLMCKCRLLDAGPESNIHTDMLSAFMYNKKAFARFIQEHRLQSKLISFLHQENLYSEIDSDQTFQTFASAVMDIGEYALTSADEPAIAAAQQIKSPFKPPVLNMILFRSKIAPQYARSLLVEALHSDPYNSILVNELIRVSGYSEAELILEAYKNSADQSGYVHNLRMAVEQNQSVPLWLIREFTRGLRPNKYFDYSPKTSIYTLYELCLAANTRSEKTLITDADIEMLMSQTLPDGSKPDGNNKQDMAKYNVQQQNAFIQIKKKLISSLEIMSAGN